MKTAKEIGDAMENCSKRIKNYQQFLIGCNKDDLEFRAILKENLSDEKKWMKELERAMEIETGNYTIFSKAWKRYNLPRL